MKKKLIIWDFDGVIADTEKLWLKNRQYLLKQELGIDWSWKKINQHLRGTSDKTKKEILDQLGIVTDDPFWQKIAQLDIRSMQEDGFSLTEGIEEIFKLRTIKQCIATGGDREKTAKKIKIVGIEKYFPPERVFTADMVCRGKPEPDIFLLAAQTMGEKPQDCLVIEDSVAGLRAALKAGCTPVAFLTGDLSGNEKHLQDVRRLGIQYIVHHAADLKKLIEQLF